QIDPLVAAFSALEVLHVKFHDAFAERPNPVLRIAVENNVADIKPRLNRGTFEFVDVSGHFERAEKKLVPDLLDANDDAKFLCKRNQLANLRLRARPRVMVRGLGIHNGGDDEHDIGTPELRVVQRSPGARKAFLYDDRVGGGKWKFPVG